MYREDVPYLTFTPHRCLQTAWTRHYDQPELFYPDRLLKLRELAAEDPEITLEKLEDEAVKAKIRDEMNDAVVEKQKLQFIKGRHKGRALRKASVTKAKASKPRVSANANEDSPLYGFQVGVSKSSKINWIVKEVRRALAVQSVLKLKCLGHSQRSFNTGKTRSSSFSRRARFPSCIFPRHFKSRTSPSWSILLPVMLNFDAEI